MLRLWRSPWLWGSALVVILVPAALWRLTSCPRGGLTRLDPAAPYRIEFGRGSGWHGLDTVKVTDDGSVVLHVFRHNAWYVGGMSLPQPALAQVLEAVDDNHLLAMHKGYHADVCDGTQWVLWITQGDDEKSVYFNNHFPKEIIAFARSLDEVLVENGVGKLSWLPVAPGTERSHAKELWESIRR